MPRIIPRAASAALVALALGVGALAGCGSDPAVDVASTPEPAKAATTVEAADFAVAPAFGSIAERMTRIGDRFTGASGEFGACTSMACLSSLYADMAAFLAPEVDGLVDDLAELEAGPWPACVTDSLGDYVDAMRFAYRGTAIGAAGDITTANSILHEATPLIVAANGEVTSCADSVS